MGARAAVYGACYGVFPIGCIVLNVIFIHDMNCASGRFKVLQESLMGITQDRRLQLLLIPFSFGAFFEGPGGVCAPVVGSAALLIALRVQPLPASSPSPPSHPPVVGLVPLCPP